jgi:hypothetical protein
LGIFAFLGARVVYLAHDVPIVAYDFLSNTICGIWFEVMNNTLKNASRRTKVNSLIHLVAG